MRTPTALLLAALALAACRSEPAEPGPPVAEPEPAAVPNETVNDTVSGTVEGADELIGEWVITEQAGTAPEDVYVVTFTREGDYIVQNQFGSTERSTFRPAGGNLVVVTDSAESRRFEYEVEGITLTLTVPGTETRTVLERRDGS